LRQVEVAHANAANAEVAAKEAEKRAQEAETEAKRLAAVESDAQGLQKRAEDAEALVQVAERRAEEAEARAQKFAEVEAAARAAQERAEQAESRLSQVEAAHANAANAEVAEKSAEERATNAEARVLQLEAELKRMADVQATNAPHEGAKDIYMRMSERHETDGRPDVLTVQNVATAAGGGCEVEPGANATASTEREDAVQVCAIGVGGTEVVHKNEQRIHNESEDEPTCRPPAGGVDVVEAVSSDTPIGSRIGPHGALLEAVYAASIGSMMLLSDIAVLAGAWVGLDVASITMVINYYSSSLLAFAEAALGLGPRTAACQAFIGAEACSKAYSSLAGIAIWIRGRSDDVFAAVASARPAQEGWWPSLQGRASASEGDGPSRDLSKSPSGSADDSALWLVADRILVVAWLTFFAYAVVWRGIIGMLIGDVLIGYVVMGPVRAAQACRHGRNGLHSVYDI